METAGYSDHPKLLYWCRVGHHGFPSKIRYIGRNHDLSNTYIASSIYHFLRHRLSIAHPQPKIFSLSHEYINIDFPATSVAVVFCYYLAVILGRACSRLTPTSQSKPLCFASIPWIVLFVFWRPSLVFAQLPPPEIIKACNHLNITVIDVQHGIIASHHPLYSRLQSLGLKIDHLYCWTEATRATASQAFPDLFASTTVHSKPSAQVSISSQSNRAIIITLQWGMEDSRDPLSMSYHYKQQFLSGLPFDLLQAIRSYSFEYRCQIIVRPHPLQLSTHRANLQPFLAKIESLYPEITIDAPSNNLQIHLNNATLANITPASSTAIEFSEFNIPSIALVPDNTACSLEYYEGMRNSMKNPLDLITVKSVYSTDSLYRLLCSLSDPHYQG